MINNRQNGRRRGRGGGGNNGQRNGNPGNPNSGNRIDNRARGNANQLYEKYKNLARDAQMSGDRVNTEYYLQFADHYFRVLSESRSRFEEQNPNAPQQRRIQPVDSFDEYDGDDDYVEEGEPIRAGEQNGQREQQRDTYRDNGRDNGRDNARDNGRDQREGGYRQQSRRDEGFDRDARGDQNMGGNWRGNGQPQRDEQPRGDRYANGNAAMTATPVANDLGEDASEGAEPSPIEPPRRRGRPRREAVVEQEAPAALEADRLPPSLSIASEPAGDDDETPPPRRRRRVANGGEAPPVA